MAFLPLIAESDATGLLKQMYDEARARAGSVANIIKVMSREPRAAQASIQFYVSLMRNPGPLDPARREMLATVVSNINGCYY